MRVLICGGRDLCRHEAFNWLERNLFDEISFATGCSVVTIDAIIHGGAKGADQAADDWAKSENIKSICFPANWKKHGKAAGPIRNRQMIDQGRPDIVVALPGGRGTRNMINQADGEGIQIIEVKT